MSRFPKFRISLILVGVFLATCNAGFGGRSQQENAVLDKCLQSYGGLTPENAVRLDRYKQWSDQYEEIPCFTNCYLSKMLDIYNETHGFNEENVIREFGQVLYNNCQRLMFWYGNSCQTAYSGFHCLVKLEDDPLIKIDSIANMSRQGRQAMKHCLKKFDPYEWQKFKDYAKFPVHEPINCFTKCFIDKLELYNHKTSQWRLEDMTYHLGVPLSTANVDHCAIVGQKAHRNACSWIYTVFTCYVMAK